MKKSEHIKTTGEGQTLNVLGHTAVLKLASAETKGDYYTFALISPPGAGVPPHVHKREDEIVYIVEGECAIQLASETYRAPAGTTIHFPRGVPHGFQNVGPTAAKTFWTIVPGASFESFFNELAVVPVADLERVAAVFNKYEIELLSPRPAV
jgi:quercetin dioxygenase-like cupin family protein